MRDHIKVLDCTLRDGGYCNQWEFGFQNAGRIVQGLLHANIDIVECGFLTERTTYRPDVTKFNILEQIQSILPLDRSGRSFVCMMNYGEFDVDHLPVYDGSSINGIRVAFHKRDRADAMEVCRKIQQKGYDVYIQPMVSQSYSREEFIDLIEQSNQIDPKAFYIVDSFGSMKRHELVRLFEITNQYLKSGICIGFHSHNNMQLAYSNAQTFVALDTDHQRIVDSSVFGMGRGAGNLNTELFVEHLNEVYGKHYELKPLLRLIDEILNYFYQQNYWGYSLPNYLSAKHNAHPNYAGYLDDKKTLTIEDMESIFGMMDGQKKVSYDKAYAESLYLSYMDQSTAQNQHAEELKHQISGKTVLLIAPGKNTELEKDKICEFARQTNVVSIGVNYRYPYLATDYIFVSNLRRFKNLEQELYSKTIITSNIKADGVYLQTSYGALLNDVEYVQDNAGMMLIQYLISMGASKIVLAGMDGYRHDDEQNYAQKDMTYVMHNVILDNMNKGMRTMLRRFSKQVEIYFLTTSLLVNAIDCNLVPI